MSRFPLLCPRCRQGPDLHKVKIPEIKQTLYVCFECDATWIHEEEIGKIPPMDYTTYLRGKRVDQKEITEIVLD
ncbi:MAG: hypothetical protein AAGK14_12925 [Verrucomicrobiota bacterium]